MSGLESITAQEARTRGVAEHVVQELDEQLDLSDLDDDRQPHVEPSVEGEAVIVPTATTSQRDPHYHKPAGNPMRAACGSLRNDGQRLSREHADGLGMPACQADDCFGGETSDAE